MLALLALAVILLTLLVNWRLRGGSLGGFLGLGTVRSYAALWHGCTFPKAADLPESGPAIVVVNHTSSPDGCFVQCGCRRGLTFLIAREFFKNPFAAWVWGTTDCVPVERSCSDPRAAREGLRRLDQGRVVAVFPEGTLSGAGLGRLRTGKCGAAWLALRSKAPVFPAFISGGPQHPRVGPGWLLPSRRRVRVYYGPPLDLSRYYGHRITRKLLEEVTARIMASIAALDPARGRG